MRKVIESIVNMDLDQIALDIARTETFKKLVISINTEGVPTSQLFELGEDATGRTLESIGGEYSPFTVEVKKSNKKWPDWNEKVYNRPHVLTPRIKKFIYQFGLIIVDSIF